MLTKITKKYRSENNNKLLSNYISLLILQGVNYMLPLFTIPYLIRVLGVEYFGLLAFATATITYFNIITDYGFNLTATRDISVHRNKKTKVVEIFSSVMMIKFILMFVSMIILLIIVFSFERFSRDWEVYFLTFGKVVGEVLFPVWFFQGMERMKYITYLNILAKSIFTIAIFIFVKKQSDLYIVPFLTSLGFIVAGIWSLVLIKRKFGVYFKWQTKEIIIQYFKDGWPVFVSRIFVSLYTVTNILLLGLFTNNIIVGYYSIAERIINAAGGMFQPANRAIYPHMAKLYSKNKDRFYIFTKKIVILYLLSSILLFFGMYLFGEFIIIFVNGQKDIYIKKIYSILMFTLITIPFGPLFTQVMIIEKRNKEFSQVVKYAFIFNIILAPIAIYLYNGIGLAGQVVLSQIFVVTLCVIKVRSGYKNERI